MPLSSLLGGLLSDVIPVNALFGWLIGIGFGISLIFSLSRWKRNNFKRLDSSVPSLPSELLTAQVEGIETSTP